VTIELYQAPHQGQKLLTSKYAIMKMNVPIVYVLPEIEGYNKGVFG